MRAAAAVERIGLTVMVYVGDMLLITPYDEMEFGKYKSNEGFLAVKRVVPSIAEYIADGHVSVDKIFARSNDPVILRMAREKIEQIPGVRVMSSATDNIEVVTPAADKGNALGMLCRQLGTDPVSYTHLAGQRQLGRMGAEVYAAETADHGFAHGFGLRKTISTHQIISCMADSCAGQ